MDKPGATVVISHHILVEFQSQYEQWLDEIGSVCRSFPGHLDWQIIRPIPGLTFTYEVIIRFDTIENLRTWMESEERKTLIDKAKPWFATGDHFVIRSGLDFLFAPDQKAPARWKQFLVTWSAIYPLSIVIPMFIMPLFQIAPIPDTPIVKSFFVSGIIVFIMVFLLMPNYSKLIRKWLYT